MKILPIVALALGVCAPLANLPADDTPLYRPINPALLYWQAAAQLAPVKNAQATELSKMASGDLPANRDKINQFYTGTAKKIMRKAALSPAPCDWGLPLEEGPGINLVHVAKLQQMANLAIAEGELSFAANQPGEGCDWLLIVHRMARHASTDGSLVGLAVQGSLENLALRAAARHCLAWDDKSRATYAEQRAKLPPLQPLPDVYRSDYELLTDWMERLSRLTGPARTAAMQAAFPRDDNDISGAPKEPDPASWDAATWQQEIAAYREYQTRVVEVAGKSWKDGHREMDSLEQSIHQSRFYFCRQVAALPTTTLTRAFTNVTLRTMLEAALRYGNQIDAAKAATFRDSFEEEPLQLRKTDDGTLILVAAHEHPEGRSIELKLGK